MPEIKYSSPDESNKQQQMKIISGSDFKLKEPACAMWNLIRLLPLMLGELIEKNDCTWICLITFSIERLCASSFSNSHLIKLDLVIDSF